MRWAILDTNVFIGHWEQGLYAETLATVQRTYIVRHSAVVLSELRRGARTPAARNLVDGLHRFAHDPWEPTARDWWRAGVLIQQLGDARGWNTAKRRDFQNDALIALTARSYGAAVVTADLADFALLARTLAIRIVHV